MIEWKYIKHELPCDGDFCIINHSFGILGSVDDYAFYIDNVDADGMAAFILEDGRQIRVDEVVWWTKIPGKKTEEGFFKELPNV